MEGGDQAGKSFVCDVLKDRLGYPVHHFSAPTEKTDFRLEYVQPIIQSDTPIIFDRSYMSEMVYGPIARGVSGITPEIKKYVEDVLRSYNYVLVYLRNENWKYVDREGEMYTQEIIKKTREEYENVYREIGIPKMKDDSFSAGCIDRILAFYKNHNPGYAQKQD